MSKGCFTHQATFVRIAIIIVAANIVVVVCQFMTPKKMEKNREKMKKREKNEKTEKREKK